jgi:hypothetical protein
MASIKLPTCGCRARTALPNRLGRRVQQVVSYAAVPFLKWIVLGLTLTAVITVIAGLAASISVLRSRGVESQILVARGPRSQRTVNSTQSGFTALYRGKAWLTRWIGPEGGVPLAADGQEGANS